MIKSRWTSASILRTRRAGGDVRPELPLDPGALAGLLSLEQAMPLLALEFDRARRYERSLAFLSLPARAVRRTPRDVSRTSDIAALDSEKGVLVVCAPEGTAGGMAQLARRLTDDEPASSAQALVASFPDDGFVFDALLRAVLG